jgi:peptidoglycan/LPS O-acetylase OafA/YrhL
MASSERTKRTAGLDGLRAIAALSVLCLHVWLYGQPDPARPRRSGVLEHAVFELRLGLVFFFVLSGYLLYRAFAGAALRGAGRVDVRRYARRRVARIVPAYWLSLVGAVALLWSSRGGPGVRLPDAGGLPLFAVFGQNYSHATFMRLNPVTWTLCLEAAFYLALPLIGVAAYRFARGRFAAQAWLLIGLIGVGVAYAAAHRAAGWDAMAGKALPAYLPHFACGMLVALWAERRRALGASTAGGEVTAARGAPPLPGEVTAARGAPPLPGRVTAALVIGGFGLAVADGFWHAVSPASDPALAIVGDIPAAVGFAAVVAAVVAGRGPSIEWTRARPLAWVGLVSYGIYLWHVPLILFARSNGLLPFGFVPALAAMLPPVLAVAAASWYLVERPLMARAERARRAARVDERVAGDAGRGTGSHGPAAAGDARVAAANNRMPDGDGRTAGSRRAPAWAGSRAPRPAAGPAELEVQAAP